MSREKKRGSRPIAAGAALALTAAMLLSLATGCQRKQSTAAVSSGTPLEFSIAMDDNSLSYLTTIKDINNEKWVQAFDKKYNVKMTITLLSHKNLQQAAQVMFASGKVPDIFRMYNTYLDPKMCNSVQGGVFMPLDSVIATAKGKGEINNLLKKLPAKAWDREKYNGKTYGIPNEYLSVSSRRATYIRKDLLEKTGLKAPTTLDEMVKVLQAFKSIGVKYPYAGRQNFAYTDIVFGAYGLSYSSPYDYSLTKDGKLEPDMVHPEMLEALKLMASLRQQGLMDPESLTTSQTDWNNKIYTGQVGMFDMNANLLDTYNANLKQNVPTGEFELIASPAGPDGKRGMYKYPLVQESTYINKNFKHAERFLVLLDQLASDKGQEFLALGEEGTDYTKDSGGKIQYTYPTNATQQSAIAWRQQLGFIADQAYNPILINYQPAGQNILSWMKNVGTKEGKANIEPGDLASINAHPELQPGNCDLFMQMASKVFYGQGSADQLFSQFVSDYMSRGGNDIVKEATAAYKAGKTFTDN